MAALTAAALLDRIQTVLEAAPLSLTPAVDPFTDEGVANALVNTTFRLVHGGVVNTRSTSNYQALRIDRVIVTVERSLAFDGYQAQQDLQDLLDDIERVIIADGPGQGYMVTVDKGSRKVTRKKESDVLEGAIHFLCDYDFDESNA